MVPLCIFLCHCNCFLGLLTKLPLETSGHTSVLWTRLDQSYRQSAASPELGTPVFDATSCPGTPGRHPLLSAVESELSGLASAIDPETQTQHIPCEIRRILFPAFESCWERGEGFHSRVIWVPVSYSFTHQNCVAFPLGDGCAVVNKPYPTCPPGAYSLVGGPHTAQTKKGLFLNRRAQSQGANMTGNYQRPV